MPLVMVLLLVLGPEVSWIAVGFDETVVSRLMGVEATASRPKNLVRPGCSP